MRNILYNRFSSCILGLLVVVMAGCASSTPSRFYQLNSVSSQAMVARDVPIQGGVIVTVGPLRIPDYLDRPQIMTRSGKNELKLSDFDRWAGSLENDVSRVLVENMSTLLPPDRFFVMRWTPMSGSQLPASYRVEVLIERFEGTPGGSVSLKAQWIISGQSKRLLFRKESNISEQVNGSSYRDLVETMSKVLELLSRDIADGIISKTGMEQSEPER